MHLDQALLKSSLLRSPIFSSTMAQCICLFLYRDWRGLGSMKKVFQRLKKNKNLMLNLEDFWVFWLKCVIAAKKNPKSKILAIVLS